MNRGAGVEIEIGDQDDEGCRSMAHLRFPVEAAAIDRFVHLVRELRLSGDAATLRLVE